MVAASQEWRRFNDARWNTTITRAGKNRTHRPLKASGRWEGRPITPSDRWASVAAGAAEDKRFHQVPDEEIDGQAGGVYGEDDENDRGQGERERMMREEERRKQDVARIEREHKFWASERAWIEAQDAALMEALHKLTTG